MLRPLDQPMLPMHQSLDHSRLTTERPAIVSPEDDEAFRAKVRQVGLDPDGLWIGGYVHYEWDHLRVILETYGLQAEGRRVLEFGCNIGASAIVLAHLGAVVSAVDVDLKWLDLARSNASRFGRSGDIEFRRIEPDKPLPFEDQSMDLVICNSVLEYVQTDHLQAVKADIDRVLKPGGRVLITGTSSRLWPKEVHSGRWFTNYMPRAMDGLFDEPPMRGVLPWVVRGGPWSSYINLDQADRGGAFLRSRRAMGYDSWLLRSMAGLARLFSVGPGMLAYNMSCLLEKPAAVVSDRPSGASGTSASVA